MHALIPTFPILIFRRHLLKTNTHRTPHYWFECQQKPQTLLCNIPPQHYPKNTNQIHPTQTTACANTSDTDELGACMCGSLSVCAPVRPSICLLLPLSACLPVCLAAYRSVDLFIWRSLCVFASMFVPVPILCLRLYLRLCLCVRDLCGYVNSIHSSYVCLLA